MLKFDYVSMVDVRLTAGHWAGKTFITDPVHREFTFNIVEQKVEDPSIFCLSIK